MLKVIGLGKGPGFFRLQATLGQKRANPEKIKPKYSLRSRCARDRADDSGVVLVAS